MKITKEQFIDDYCLATGYARNHVVHFYDAVPCDCGKKECQGWKMLNMKADEQWMNRKSSAD